MEANILEKKQQLIDNLKNSYLRLSSFRKWTLTAVIKEVFDNSFSSDFVICDTIANNINLFQTWFATWPEISEFDVSFLMSRYRILKKEGLLTEENFTLFVALERIDDVVSVLNEMRAAKIVDEIRKQGIFIQLVKNIEYSYLYTRTLFLLRDINAFVAIGDYWLDFQTIMQKNTISEIYQLLEYYQEKRIQDVDRVDNQTYHFLIRCTKVSAYFLKLTMHLLFFADRLSIKYPPLVRQENVQKLIEIANRYEQDPTKKNEQWLIGIMSGVSVFHASDINTGWLDDQFKHLTQLNFEDIIKNDSPYYFAENLLFFYRMGLLNDDERNAEPIRVALNRQNNQLELSYIRRRISDSRHLLVSKEKTVNNLMAIIENKHLILLNRFIPWVSIRYMTQADFDATITAVNNYHTTIQAACDVFDELHKYTSRYPIDHEQMLTKDYYRMILFEGEAIETMWRTLGKQKTVTHEHIKEILKICERYKTDPTQGQAAVVDYVNKEVISKTVVAVSTSPANFWVEAPNVPVYEQLVQNLVGNYA
jgi:hypothetical protein